MKKPLVHGTLYAYNNRCRCDLCVEAARNYRAKTLAKFAGEIVRLLKPEPAVVVQEKKKRRPTRQHGTVHMSNLGCDCDRCYEAKYEYVERQKAQVKGSKVNLEAQQQKHLAMFRKNPVAAIQNKKFNQAVATGSIGWNKVQSSAPSSSGSSGAESSAPEPNSSGPDGAPKVGLGE